VYVGHILTAAVMSAHLNTPSAAQVKPIISVHLRTDLVIVQIQLCLQIKLQKTDIIAKKLSQFLVLVSSI